MNENETNIISKMSIKVIGGGVYLKNKPQTITITWEIKDENGNIITPDTLSVNNIPLDPTTTSKTYHRVFSDVDFTVRAVKDGVLAIGTTTARFVGPTQTVEDSLTSNSRSIAASANSVRLLNEKIENNSSFKGLFISLDDLKKKFRSGNNGDWAIVGEGIPAPIYIWNKNGWEATGGQYTGSTIDLDSYYTKEGVADYTDDYNVSKNHSHIVKIYDLVNWKVVERKPDAPVFQLGQSYDAGEVVNMTDDNDSSYECLQPTITAPYLSQEVRSFTLAEAISFLPEDLRVTGQKISFLSSELNAWMTYVFTGGDYTNLTYWEIFTNNIDPDTNQKIADLQAKDEDLQNQINEDVTNLNNHIAESDAKFEEIDNTLTEHEDRMDDIEDEILLSSVEAACAPKDVEILADRAYKDHLGNIIADEYITRDTLTEEIIDITNQQVTDLKPGSVQPEDLSEAVKQMIGCKKITNLPDEEDITVTEDNTLKFKDREYSPKDYSGMGKKILRKHYIDGINTLTQHMINKPNTIYVIRYDYCLQGQTIEIPENCVLEFDGGSLRNGNLNGNNTIIKYNNNYIFDNIDILGTWNVRYISTRMFKNLCEVNSLKNVFNLTSDNYVNEITIEKEEYEYTLENLKNNLGCLNVKSNTNIIILGTIRIKPNNFTHYRILDIEYAENVTVTGSGHIYGDKTVHTGTTGEWGHCVAIYDSKDVTIEGINIHDAWGDCIVVSAYESGEHSNNIIIKNCTLDNGRRQGISVTSSNNVQIINCNISNINGTAPESAIDYEPNADETQCNCIVENCLIDNCIQGIIGYCPDSALASNYHIRNCKITNVKENGIAAVGISNVEISNCEINTSKDYPDSKAAVLLQKTNAIVRNSIIEANDNIVGIFQMQNKKLIVEGCIVSCNNYSIRSASNIYLDGNIFNSKEFLYINGAVVNDSTICNNTINSSVIIRGSKYKFYNNKVTISEGQLNNIFNSNNDHIDNLIYNNIFEYTGDTIINNVLAIYGKGNIIKNNKVYTGNKTKYGIQNFSTYSAFDDNVVEGDIINGRRIGPSSDGTYMGSKYYKNFGDFYDKPNFKTELDDSVIGIEYYCNNNKAPIYHVKNGLWRDAIGRHISNSTCEIPIATNGLNEAFVIKIPLFTGCLKVIVGSHYNSISNDYYSIYNFSFRNFSESKKNVKSHVEVVNINSDKDSIDLLDYKRRAVYMSFPILSDDGKYIYIYLKPYSGFSLQSILQFNFNGLLPHSNIEQVYPGYNIDIQLINLDEIPEDAEFRDVFVSPSHGSTAIINELLLPYKGCIVFNDTLKKITFGDGEKWVDATGTTV